jgi:hypothetical protein
MIRKPAATRTCLHKYAVIYKAVLTAAILLSANCIKIPVSGFRLMTESKTFEGKIEHIGFSVPYNCRQEWRDFLRLLKL